MKSDATVSRPRRTCQAIAALQFLILIAPVGIARGEPVPPPARPAVDPAQTTDSLASSPATSRRNADRSRNGVRRMRWSLVMGGGSVSNGFSDELKSSLERSDFAQTSPGGCFWFFGQEICFSPTDYPLEKGGDNSSFYQAAVELPSSWQVSLTQASADFMGWKGNDVNAGQLEIQGNVGTVSLMIGYGSPVRIALGPSLVRREVSHEASHHLLVTESSRALGAVGEIGVRIPTFKFFILDAALRHYANGSETAGPYDVTSSSGSHTYPATKLPFAFTSLTLAIGIRL